MAMMASRQHRRCWCSWCSWLGQKVGRMAELVGGGRSRIGWSLGILRVFENWPTRDTEMDERDEKRINMKVRDVM